MPRRYEGDREIRVAARIPVDGRKFLTLDISGQKFALADPPMSDYSSGYAWYHLGSTRLAKGMAKLTLMVNPPDGVDLAIDAILLCPGKFTPSGITMPDAISFSTAHDRKSVRGKDYRFKN